jgi:hypothetical protein
MPGTVLADYRQEKTDSSKKHLGFFVTDPSALSDLTNKGINYCLRNPGNESYSYVSKIEEVAEESISVGKFEPPIIEYSPVEIHVNRMISLQKWHGYVLSVLDNSIWVRLIDLTNNGPDEETEISLEEITEEDWDLIKPGAIFYWSIGYLDLYSGQRLRTSVIRFQRMPAWRDEEIRAAHKEAEELQNSINWE